MYLKNKTYKILLYPDKRLRKKAKLVKYFNNKELLKKIKKMFYIMNIYNGIGLSATQININLKIIVINIKNKIVLINPKIIKKKGKFFVNEGCLSIPNRYEKIKRYKNILIETKLFNGKKILIKAKNLLSACIQHEMDHLIGKLFIDYVKNND